MWVKALGLLLEGYPEDLLLFDAQCRYAAIMGVLPEDIALVVFRDVSLPAMSVAALDADERSRDP